jgi:hypothetical protein
MLLKLVLTINEVSTVLTSNLFRDFFFMHYSLMKTRVPLLYLTRQ